MINYRESNNIAASFDFIWIVYSVFGKKSLVTVVNFVFPDVCWSVQSHTEFEKALTCIVILFGHEKAVMQIDQPLQQIT